MMSPTSSGRRLDILLPQDQPVSDGFILFSDILDYRKISFQRNGAIVQCFCNSLTCGLLLQIIDSAVRKGRQASLFLVTVTRCCEQLKTNSSFHRSPSFHWQAQGMSNTITSPRKSESRIEPTAAAPSQPDCLGVSCSDHSAGSKESASWRALELRSDWHGRLGVGRREKEGKETSGRGSQDEPAQDQEENGSWMNSAKR